MTEKKKKTYLDKSAAPLGQQELEVQKSATGNNETLNEGITLTRTQETNISVE